MGRYGGNGAVGLTDADGSASDDHGGNALISLAHDNLSGRDQVIGHRLPGDLQLPAEEVLLAAGVLHRLYAGAGQGHPHAAQAQGMGAAVANDHPDPPHAGQPLSHAPG